MSTTPETVPTAWSADDENFFRAVSDVFAPTFLWGSAVLLESYDDDLAVIPALAVPTSHPARKEPAAAWPLAA